MKKALNRTQHNQIFVGREAQSALIFNSYERFLNGHSSTITVTGTPGVGKSALIDYCVKTQRPKYYLYIKCRNLDGIDIAAISQMIEKVTDCALTLPQTELKKVQVLLDKSLGKDLSLLNKISPSIKRIMKNSLSEADHDFIKIKYRLKNAIFKLISIVAKYCSPMVIVVDDIQWMDTITAEALKTLVKKIESSNIMLILACRSNEKNRELESLWPVLKDRTTMIPINNLNMTEMQQYFTLALGNITKDTDELADAIFKITKGNPFYTENLVRIILHDASEKTKRDSKQVVGQEVRYLKDRETAEHRINRDLSETYRNDQTLLEWVSCFQNVEFSLISEMTDLGKAETARQIQELVDASILIQQVSHGFASISFSHDILNKLVYANIDNERKQRIHFLIAERMYRSVNRTDAYNGVIAAHLLKSNKNDLAANADDWIDFLYDVGVSKKAIALIDEAREIFECCILIGSYCKVVDKAFEVNLRLEWAECLCLLEKADKALDIIAQLKAESLEKETLETVSFKELYIYHYMRRHDKVIALGIYLLRDMGLPVNRISMPKDLLSLKFLYSKKRIAKIIALPSITDKKLLRKLDILTLMTICATLSDNVMAACLCLKAAIICGGTGKSPYSLVGYVSAAYILLSVWKDRRRAFLLAQAIYKLMEKAENQNKSFAYFILGTFFSLYSQSLAQSEDDLEKAIEYGEITGDFVFLGYAIQSSLDNKAFMGCTTQELRRFVDWAREEYADMEQTNVMFNLDVYEAHVKALKQGEREFDANSISKNYPSLTTFETFTEKGLTLQRMFLFGEKEKAYFLAKTMEPDMRLLEGMISSIDIYLFIALVRISHHENLSTKDQLQNIRKIKRSIRRLRDYSAQNAREYDGAYALMLAEYTSKIKREIAFDHLYNRAIMSAKENRRIKALALLLYAKVCSNPIVASHMAKESAKLHKAYGAEAVADRIRSIFGLENVEAQQNSITPVSQGMGRAIEACEHLNERDTLEAFFSYLVSQVNIDTGMYIFEKNKQLMLIDYTKSSKKSIKHKQETKLCDAYNVAAFIVRHTWRTEKAVFYNSEDETDIFANDPEIIKNPNQYIACLPIICHEAVAGLIYLARQDNALDADTLKQIKRFLPIIASKMTHIRSINLTRLLSEKPLDTTLSIREMDVLKLMAKGQTNAQICKQLNIAQGTAKNHVSNVLAKLNAVTRIEAVHLAKEKNLI